MKASLGFATKLTRFETHDRLAASNPDAGTLEYAGSARRTPETRGPGEERRVQSDNRVRSGGPPFSWGRAAF